MRDPFLNVVTKMRARAYLLMSAFRLIKLKRHGLPKRRWRL